MKLTQFNLICLIDINGGMSKDGHPPKYLKSWSDYVRMTTIGNKNNAVVMGRYTYEMLLKDGDRKSLQHRENHVISTK
jgi:dihydrofolate reductase